MSKIDNKQLAALGSMAELKAAKQRVNRAIRRKEKYFEGQYESARDMFSWTNLLCYGFSLVDNLQSIFRYVGKGFSAGLSRIRKGAAK